MVVMCQSLFFDRFLGLCEMEPFPCFRFFELESGPSLFEMGRSFLMGVVKTFTVGGGLCTKYVGTFFPAGVLPQNCPVTTPPHFIRQQTIRGVGVRQVEGKMGEGPALNKNGHFIQYRGPQGNANANATWTFELCL